MSRAAKRPRHPQPMQPMVWDGKALRFQANAIVKFFVDTMTSDAPIPTFNDLMAMPWSDADRDQFNQLHGYSVSGLPYRNRATQRRASAYAADLVARRYRGSAR